MFDRTENFNVSISGKDIDKSIYNHLYILMLVVSVYRR